MEFPELGTHCAVSSCSQLDFLPFECDCCHKIFCIEHKTYEQHDCTEAYTKDARVPVCPLCGSPVPVNRGEDPNIKVDEHIQKDCTSDKAKKALSNRCSFPGCKKKELVPVTCSTCRKNFCLKHRFETDHSCQGHPNRVGTRPAKTTSRIAPSRGSGSPRGGRTSRNPQVTTMAQIGAELNRERMMRQQQRQQPHRTAAATSPTQAKTRPATTQPQHMSEDEALALALAASMGDKPQHLTQPPPPVSRPQPSTSGECDEDEALARAIAASLNDEQPKPKPKKPTTTSSSPQSHRTDKESCTIS